MEGCRHRLKHRSVLVLLGEFEAGLLYQLERIHAYDPETFRPIVTYTTNPNVLSARKRWLRSVSDDALRALDITKVITVYRIEQFRYLVTSDDLRKGLNERHIGLLGMTPEGYERLLSVRDRWRGEPHHLRTNCDDRRQRTTEYHVGLGTVEISAITITPRDLKSFSHALMCDFDYPVDRAIECVERLRQQTTRPPPKTSGTFHVEIPANGPRDHSVLTELASLLPPKVG
ncbi:hypothetical protein GF380_04650 [Candidatus Uhrbacteria bacterium]|nr:hypothetical protein [Candidatus Uhrbacteria bacterium]MBD3284345.1 hypothetical protein [Candidatus Uhrbacteria bacterium]